MSAFKQKPLAWKKEGDCIRTTSHCANADGYPMMSRYGKKCVRICRLILMRRRKAEIPAGIVARHICDHPWCINPAHIIEGTVKDNNRDMIERGRQVRGEQSKTAKLTDARVRNILSRRAAKTRRY